MLDVFLSIVFKHLQEDLLVIIKHFGIKELVFYDICQIADNYIYLGSNVSYSGIFDLGQKTTCLF